MRTWGRVPPTEANPSGWVAVVTDPVTGSNDAVWLTTLCQCLLLNLGESPMFGNYGIPAQQSQVTQVFPDYYVWQTQQQFAPYFASIIINRLPGPTPAYAVNVVTHAGVNLAALVPIPT
jgi:hypothetical protein